MSTTRKFDIAVVGAGLGGLSAAAYLMQRGHRVRIYERSSTLSEIGAGIQISANAMRVLEYLGLKESLEAAAVFPAGLRFRAHDTGDLLHELPLGQAHQAQYGARYLHIHRADLHRLLVELVASMDPRAIHLDTVVTGYRESRAKANVLFKSRPPIECDLLIGADGIKSIIRPSIARTTAPEFTGNVAWRATVSTAALPANFMDKDCSVWVGPGAHAVVYYLRRGALINFVGIVENDSWLDESWTVKDSWDKLKHDFNGWHSKIQALIDRLPKDGCFRWALYSRAPTRGWSTQRATILGDAAHATLPFMAQGAAMAIEDGVILGRCLEECESLRQALSCYEASRLERTARVQDGSRAMAELYHYGSASQFRERLTRQNLTVSFGQWLYGYDPHTVPLTIPRTSGADHS